MRARLLEHARLPGCSWINIHPMSLVHQQANPIGCWGTSKACHKYAPGRSPHYLSSSALSRLESASSGWVEFFSATSSPGTLSFGAGISPSSISSSPSFSSYSLSIPEATTDGYDLTISHTWHSSSLPNVDSVTSAVSSRLTDTDLEVENLKVVQPSLGRSGSLSRPPLCKLSMNGACSRRHVIAILSGTGFLYIIG